MKSESVVRKRLHRLRDRYLRRYVVSTQERRHVNCRHNVEHVPRRLPYSAQDIPSTELDISPRKVTTLLVIQEDAPVRLCSLGSESPDGWAGVVCDRDSISSRCPDFSPRVSVQEAADQFLSFLADDKYVYDNHRDVAALQWALEDRRPKRSLASRFFRWVFRIPDVPSLPAPPAPGAAEELDEELRGLWR